LHYSEINETIIKSQVEIDLAYLTTRLERD